MLTSMGCSGVKFTIMSNFIISHGLTYLTIHWKNLEFRLKIMPSLREDHLESLCIVKFGVRNFCVEFLWREFVRFVRDLLLTKGLFFWVIESNLPCKTFFLLDIWVSFIVGVCVSFLLGIWVNLSYLLLTLSLILVFGLISTLNYKLLIWPLQIPAILKEDLWDKKILRIFKSIICGINFKNWFLVSRLVCVFCLFPSFLFVSWFSFVLC